MKRAVLNLRDDRPSWAFPDEAAERIRAAFGADWDVVDVQAPVSGRADGGSVSAEALAAARGAEVWIGYGMPREIFEAAQSTPPGLRWVHTASAGVRSMLRPDVVAADVVITNAAGVHAEPIAETVIAGMLHFARGFDVAVRAQAARRWEKWPFEQAPISREIGGATLGIVGFGGIGESIARRAHALGMDIRAVRSSDRPGPAYVQLLRGQDALETIFRECEYIVLALPSTPETHGLIGAELLATVRADTVLVNVGRGDVVDEDALVRALAARQLRGAMLDVFAEEPLPPSSPLWRLDNTLILPHVSAGTPHFWTRQTELIVDNVQRFTAGLELRNVIDKQRGY